jgi:multiple sugar transport system ATP-binding protein
MVYVTHDQLEAMTMSTRIAVMKDGVLQQFAPPAEIYGRPANRFVAGFIGTPAMSLLDGTLAHDGPAARLHIGPLAIDLPGAAGVAPRAVTMGVRPEDVRVGSGPFQAMVRLVEPTGHETIVALETGGLALTARMPGGPQLRPGEAVAFDIARERIHLFDAADGQRIDLPAIRKP